MKGKTRPELKSVEVKITEDPDPDTYYLGEFTDDVHDWNILRDEGCYVADLPEGFEMPSKGRKFRFFKPYAGGENPGTVDYKKYGLSDWERMEALCKGDWCYVGIEARAVVVCHAHDDYYRTQTFTSPGLWGVESDSGKNYFLEIADEQLAELRDYLKCFNVSLVGFTKLAKQAKEKMNV